jgi:hypothetical protein
LAAAIWWWPTDRRRIVAATRQLAETISMPPSEPELVRVTRAARLSRLLAADFQLLDARGRILVDGRDAAIGLATKLQPPRGLQVSVGELDLEIDGGSGTARAHHADHAARAWRGWLARLCRDAGSRTELDARRCLGTVVPYCR